MDIFNEGLNAGMTLGQLKERERIIKVLESLADEDGDLYKPMDYLIALIKGENK